LEGDADGAADVEGSVDTDGDHDGEDVGAIDVVGGDDGNDVGAIDAEGDDDGAAVGDFVGALVGNGVAIPSIRPTNSTSPINIGLLSLRLVKVTR